MKKVLLMAFTAFVMLSACKKDEGSKSESCKVLSYTYSEDTFTSDPYILTFDSQGRITSQKSIDYGTTYTYQAGEILEQPEGESPTTYTIDSEGRITKEQPGFGSEKTFVYNSEGYLSQITSSYHNVRFVYTDGELTKVIEERGTDEITTNITYGSDYSTNDFVNSEILGVAMEIGSDVIMFHKFLGKEKRRLVSYTSTTENGVTKREDFSYSKDSNGNISSVEMSRGIGFSFAYNCK